MTQSKYDPNQDPDSQNESDLTPDQDAAEQGSSLSGEPSGADFVGPDAPNLPDGIFDANAFEEDASATDDFDFEFLHENDLDDTSNVDVTNAMNDIDDIQGGAHISDFDDHTGTPDVSDIHQANAQSFDQNDNQRDNQGPLPFAQLENTNEPLDIDEQRQVVLVKHGHRYVFRYERGEESKVLTGLVDMARDPESDLDWFDAAVLSHQLGERMSEQLQQLRRA